MFLASTSVKIAIVAVCVTMASGCQGKTNMSQYTKDKIRSAEARAGEDGKVILEVRPMLESAFFLSGAVLEDDKDRIAVSLVRCRISKECKVDFAAKVTPGGDNPYIMTIDTGNKPLDLVFEGEEDQRVFTP